MHCGDRTLLPECLQGRPRSVRASSTFSPPKIGSRAAFSACIRPLAVLRNWRKGSSPPAASPACGVVSVRAPGPAQTMGKRDNNDLSAANTTASVQVLPTSRAGPAAAFRKCCPHCLRIPCTGLRKFLHTFLPPLPSFLPSSSRLCSGAGRWQRHWRDRALGPALLRPPALLVQCRRRLPAFLRGAPHQDGQGVRRARHTHHNRGHWRPARWVCGWKALLKHVQTVRLPALCYF